MASVLRDIGSVLDFGTGAYDGILGGAESWLNDPTGAKASEQAVNQQIAFGNRALESQERMFEQQREDLAPWMEVGERSLSQLSGQMPSLTRSFTKDDFEADPGYQFRMDEAMRALEKSVAARGGLNSTRTMREMARYSQNLASNEYQRAYDRFNQDRDQKYNKLSNLAGMGQVQSGAMANTAAGFGDDAANIQMGQGNALAAHHMGLANFNRGQTTSHQQMGANMLGMAFCDQRVKENIEEITKEDIAELRKAIKPYMFNYANDIYGEGEWVGIMAQDIESTKLGAWLVERDESGILQINMNKVGSLILATLGDE